MEHDTRPDCHYGSLCYQKNPEHHTKFKHSYKRKERYSDVKGVEPQSKKLKPETTKRSSASSKSPKNLKDSKSPSLKENRKIGNSPETKETEQPSSVATSSNEHKKEGNENSSRRNSNTDADKSSHEKRYSDEGTIKCPEKEEESNEKNESSKLNDSTEDTGNTEVTETSDVNISLNNILIDDFSQLKNQVKEKYLVQMPDEFFTFWKLCKKLSPRNPIDAFKSIDIKLVGPFDILNGQCVEDGLMVTHWRHYYDPPEFQTIMLSTSKDLHFGYFRDSPDEDPVFIASNNKKDCKVTPVSSNLFTFINEEFISKKTIAKLKSNDSPSKQITSLHQKVVDFAHALKIDLETPKLSTVVRGRKSKTVCKGMSGVGIVVPYTKKTELGYRPLVKSDKELETLFRQYKDPTVDASGRLRLKSTLQEVCTWVTIAMDESDFGTGLEFGLDLFGSGIKDLHPMALDTLEVAYQFLNRDEFCDILKAHLENRRYPYVNLLDGK